MRDELELTHIEMWVYADAVTMPESIWIAPLGPSWTNPIATPVLLNNQWNRIRIPIGDFIDVYDELQSGARQFMRFNNGNAVFYIDSIRAVDPDKEPIDRDADEINAFKHAQCVVGASGGDYTQVVFNPAHSQDDNGSVEFRPNWGVAGAGEYRGVVNFEFFMSIPELQALKANNYAFVQVWFFADFAVEWVRVGYSQGILDSAEDIPANTWTRLLIDIDDFIEYYGALASSETQFLNFKSAGVGTFYAIDNVRVVKDDSSDISPVLLDVTSAADLARVSSLNSEASFVANGGQDGGAIRFAPHSDWGMTIDWVDLGLTQSQLAALAVSYSHIRVTLRLEAAASITIDIGEISAVGTLRSQLVSPGAWVDVDIPIDQFVTHFGPLTTPGGGNFLVLHGDATGGGNGVFLDSVTAIRSPVLLGGNSADDVARIFTDSANVVSFVPAGGIDGSGEISILASQWADWGMTVSHFNPYITQTQLQGLEDAGFTHVRVTLRIQAAASVGVTVLGLPERNMTTDGWGDFDVHITQFISNFGSYTTAGGGNFIGISGDMIGAGNGVFLDSVTAIKVAPSNVLIGANSADDLSRVSTDNSTATFVEDGGRSGGAIRFTHSTDWGFSIGGITPGITRDQLIALQGAGYTHVRVTIRVDSATLDTVRIVIGERFGIWTNLIAQNIDTGEWADLDIPIADFIADFNALLPGGTSAFLALNEVDVTLYLDSVTAVKV